MHKIVLPVIFVTSIITLISCEIIDPFNSIILPGRRDYTWSITEINPGYESLYLVRIWGSSPSDVWAIGQSSSVHTSIWHYNGVQWRCDSLNTIVSPTSIFGLSNNQVWLGNSENAIWRYDGAKWYEYGKYQVDGFNQLCINYFDGLSSADIYCVGFADVYNSNTVKAIIMHYSGVDWQFVNIPETKVSLESIAIDPISGVLVMSGMIYDPTGFIAKVYCWDGKELKDLAFNGPGDTYVTKLGGEIYVSAGARIYKYSDKQLLLWKDNTGTAIYGKLWCGRSKNDFFVQDYSGLSHFNGTDFTTLYKTNLAVFVGIIFEKDVFFTGYDLSTGKNYIIHGKLY